MLKMLFAIENMSLSWFSPCNRYVIIQAKFSDELEDGVPQGSVPSVSLFLIVINGLADALLLASLCQTIWPFAIYWA